MENWPQEGWKEVMSLPRQLSLIEKGSFVFPEKAALFNPIRIEPIAELESLRFDPVRIKDVAIPANEEKVLSGVNGTAMELELDIDPMEAREVGPFVPTCIGDLEGTQERIHVNERQFRCLVHEFGIQIVVHVDRIGWSPRRGRFPQSTVAIGSGNSVSRLLRGCRLADRERLGKYLSRPCRPPVRHRLP